MVFIDDATSRLMQLRFVETESTFSYFAATQGYLEAHGKPVAFYSDKHSVFWVNKAGGVATDGMTQFGRSLHALNIEIICANSSQAEGRVERANKTLRDRLVKELRLAGPPANSKDLHRPMASRETLEDAFTWRVERTLSQALTLQYDKVTFILDPTEEAQDAIGKRVEVLDYPDGRLAIRYKGADLPYRTFDKIRQVQTGHMFSVG